MIELTFKKKSIAKIIILISFLCFLQHCKKEEVKDASSDNNKEQNNTQAANPDYAIVLNQNGISFYQTALDMKSKIDSIPFGGKIILTNEAINSESPEVGNWASATYNDKKGFVYSDASYSGRDWIQMNSFKVNNEKTNKEEPAYSIVQSTKAAVYDLPSTDSKKMEDIPQFSLVNVLSSAYFYDTFIQNNIDLEMGQDRIWYEISYNNKKGYIFNSLNYPVTKELAESQLKDKVLSERGYFELTSKEPKLYNMDTKELFGSDYKIKILKENVFLDTTEARQINGEQVYLIYFSDKMSVKSKKKPKSPEEDSTPYAAYISAKDGNYFSEEKYAEYTFENTKYKGDMSALKIFKQEFEKRGIHLNYLDFTVRKISEDNYPKETYYIATARVGNAGSDFNSSNGLRSIILKQTDGIYEPVSSSIYTSKPIQYKDLDGDGVVEIIVRTPNRGGDDTTIFGLKDGKYIAMSAILSQMGIYEIEIKGDKIRGKKWITAPNGTDTKSETHIYKYEKGNFIELKK